MGFWATHLLHRDNAWAIDVACPWTLHRRQFGRVYRFKDATNRPVIDDGADAKRTDGCDVGDGKLR
jgi:hypothetical protein